MSTPPQPPSPSALPHHHLHCVHCLTTETPLWRTGPSGPKTLCNACGVRWKKTGSVIPRSKRPQSHANPLPRKRARPSHPSPPSYFTNAPFSIPHSQTFKLPTASLPAPKPVYLAANDSAKAKYESCFSGLMRVNFKPPSAAKHPSCTTTPAAGALPMGGNPAPNARLRTRTTKASAFFKELGPDPPVAKEPRPPSTTPPMTTPPLLVIPEVEGDAVYVTEVHAPSPSPSPPPMPRVKRGGGGAGFTLLLAAVADRQGVDGVAFGAATDSLGEEGKSKVDDAE